MFGKKKIEEPAEHLKKAEQEIKAKRMKSFVNSYVDTTTLIAAGTEIIGDIKFSGNLAVEGKITGNIITLDDKNCTVRVLETGVVEGVINVPSVVINGLVKGEIFSSNHIKLAEKARIEGDIQYSSIEMSKGAHVYGTLIHDSHSSSMEQAVISESDSKKASVGMQQKAH